MRAAFSSFLLFSVLLTFIEPTFGGLVDLELERNKSFQLKIAQRSYYEKHTNGYSRFLDKAHTRIFMEEKLNNAREGTELRRVVQERMDSVRHEAESYKSCIQRGNCSPGAVNSIGTVGSAIFSVFGTKVKSALFAVGVDTAGPGLLDGYLIKGAREAFDEDNPYANSDVYNDLEKVKEKYPDFYNDFVQSYNNNRKNYSSGNEFQLNLTQDDIDNKLGHAHTKQYKEIIDKIESIKKQHPGDNNKARDEAVDQLKGKLSKLTEMAKESIQTSEKNRIAIYKLIQSQAGPTAMDEKKRHMLDMHLRLGNSEAIFDYLTGDEAQQRHAKRVLGEDITVTLDAVRKDPRLMQLLNPIKQDIKQARAEQQLKVAEYEVATHILIEVIKFEDPEAAKKIGEVSQVVYRLVKMQIDSNNGVGGISTTLLSGNYILGAIQIFSIFSAPDEKTPEETILEAVQDLGKMVEELSKQMHTRFDKIDHKLNQIYFSLNEELSQIQRSLDYLKTESKTIVQNLEKIRSNNIATEKRITRMMAELANKDIQLCHTRSFTQTGTMTNESFYECEARFFNWAEFESGEEILAPSFSHSDSSTKSTNILKLSADSVYSLDNKLLNYYSKLKYLSGLINVKLPYKAINFQEWLRGVESLKKLHFHNQGHSPSVSNKGILQSLSAFLNNVEHIRKNRKILLDEALDNYENTSIELRKKILESKPKAVMANIDADRANVTLKKSESKPVSGFFDLRLLDIQLAQRPPNPDGHIVNCLRHSGFNIEYAPKIEYRNNLLKEVNLKVPNIENAAAKYLSSEKMYLIASGFATHEVCYYFSYHVSYSKASMDSIAAQEVQKILNIRKNGKIGPLSHGHYAIELVNVLKPTEKFKKTIRSYLSDENSLLFKQSILDRWTYIKSQSKKTSFNKYLEGPLFESIKITETDSYQKSSFPFWGSLITGVIHPLKDQNGNVADGHGLKYFKYTSSKDISTQVYKLDYNSFSTKFKKSMEANSGSFAYRLSTLDRLKYNSHKLLGDKEFQYLRSRPVTESALQPMTLFLHQHLDQFSKKVVGDILTVAGLVEPSEFRSQSTSSHQVEYEKSIREIGNYLNELELMKVITTHLLGIIFTDEIINDDYLNAVFQTQDGLIGKDDFLIQIQLSNLSDRFNKLYLLRNPNILRADQKPDWMGLPFDIVTEEVDKLLSYDTKPLPNFLVEIKEELQQEAL